MKLSVVDPQGSPATASVRSQPLYVLKFGSSVLRTPEDLPKVAGELYRQRRQGRRIVAVVSAFAGETDRLIREAEAVTRGLDCAGIPDLVSLGEERTMALLRLACDRIGLPAAICRPEELGLHTTGSPMAAQPVRIDDALLKARLDAVGLAIVPGFVGLSAGSERSLLGRGGSDFSAIFIGGELNAAAVRLYKDVDGVFDADPASNPAARRFSEISWSDALEVARPLIQPASVQYAASKQLVVEIETIGSQEPTRVCHRSLPPADWKPKNKLKVALAGFGVVGQAVARRLAAEPGFEISAILCRRPTLQRDVEFPCTPTTNLDQFLDACSDIIIDALSCERSGAALCLRGLASGRHVISAGKRAIAAAHPLLLKTLGESGALLLHSAAVGGSAPILETVAAARAEAAVSSVTGILNGTVNFILSKLAAGTSFEAALAQARAAGFAEEDCTSDLSGEDAEAKLRLIAHAAFGAAPASVDVEVEPLDPEAQRKIARSGVRWLQVAQLKLVNGRPIGTITLEPALSHPLLEARGGEWSTAIVVLENGAVHRCTGRGAGGAATAEAIIADLFDAAAAAADGTAAQREAA